MHVIEIIKLARKNLGKGVMDSSARVCLADAEKAYMNGDLAYAKVRAVKSIAYSVGILHEDYRLATQEEIIVDFILD